MSVCEGREDNLIVHGQRGDLETTRFLPCNKGGYFKETNYYVAVQHGVAVLMEHVEREGLTCRGIGMEGRV